MDLTKLNIKKNSSVYNAPYEIVISNFTGFIKFEDFKAKCERTLEVLKKHETSRLLVDNRALEAMPLENQHWIQTEWFPRAIELGLKHVAFLMPLSIFGQASMDNANKEAKHSPIDMYYFEFLEDALEWLVKKKAPLS